MSAKYKYDWYGEEIWFEENTEYQAAASSVEEIIVFL